MFKNILLLVTIFLGACTTDTGYVMHKNAFCEEEYTDVVVCRNKKNELITGQIQVKEKDRTLEMYVKNGFLDGVAKAYHKNGVLAGEAIIENGKMQGKAIEFYENGNIKLEENYKDNKLDGLQKYYSIDGILETESMYQDGKRDGVQKKYYENGKLKSEENCILKKLEDSRCVRNGTARYYNDDGSLAYEVKYKDNGVVPGSLKKKVIKNSDIEIAYTSVEKSEQYAKRQECFSKITPCRIWNCNSCNGCVALIDNLTVNSIKSNGVLLSTGEDMYIFLYTSKKYLSGQSVSLDNLAERKGEYEYKSSDGELHRIPAFKETNINVKNCLPGSNVF